MAKVTLNFSDVKFHIKEFQKVYIQCFQKKIQA